MDGWAVFMTIVVFLFGLFCGWVSAHNEVKNECLLQGNFYVGQTVFYCNQGA